MVEQPSLRKPHIFAIPNVTACARVGVESPWSAKFTHHCSILRRAAWLAVLLALTCAARPAMAATGICSMATQRSVRFVTPRITAARCYPIPREIAVLRSMRAAPRPFGRARKLPVTTATMAPEGDGSPKVGPVVPVNVTLVANGASASIASTATGSVSTFRIVPQQPTHGTVALAGNVATYFTQAGFSGSDSFTYAATESTGLVESNLGNVSVTVGNTTLAQLLNISTRLQAPTGDQVPSDSLILSGTDPKTVMVRGMGPSLPLVGVLADPMLELHNATGIVATNDSWKINAQTGQSQQAAIEAAGLAPGRRS